MVFREVSPLKIQENTAKITVLYLTYTDSYSRNNNMHLGSNIYVFKSYKVIELYNSCKAVYAFVYHHFG